MADAYSTQTGAVLIAAGGTGGHVFPALAIAEQLREQQLQVFWVGTRRGIEARVVPENNFPLNFLNIEGVRGRGVLAWLKAPLLLLVSIVAVLRLIRQQRIAVVLGMGGYVSVAAGLAAIMLRKPLVLQEQNAVPGSANRLLAPFAQRIFTGFGGVFASRERASWSGNPLRAEFASAPQPEAGTGNYCRILVLGGSLGARALNELLPEALALLGSMERGDTQRSTPAIRVTHQTGAKDFVKVQEAYRQSAIEADVRPFIDDMYSAYREADLVIARSGALTVSEIAAVGVAAIFVPYPHAIDDHQSANADYLARCDAAIVLEQSSLTAELLSETVHDLLADPGRLLPMALAAYAQGRRDAAQVVATACEELAHG